MQLGDGWSERFPQDDPPNAVMQRLSEPELLSAGETTMGTGNKIGAMLARSQLGGPFVPVRAGGAARGSPRGCAGGVRRVRCPRGERSPRGAPPALLLAPKRFCFQTRALAGGLLIRRYFLSSRRGKCGRRSCV